MTLVPTVRILGVAPGKPGYFTVLSANGKEAIVPNYLRSRIERTMRQQRIHPNLYKELPGDCGTSFINITTKSDGWMVFRNSGFTVNVEAIYYSWSYSLEGPGYPFYVAQKSGALGLDYSWDDPISSGPDYLNGHWIGDVSTSSYADLWTGGVCYSEGPGVNGTV